MFSSSKDAIWQISSRNQRDAWAQLSVDEHMQHYLSEGMDRKDAMKQVAKDRGVPKREIYQQLLNKDT